MKIENTPKINKHEQGTLAKNSAYRHHGADGYSHHPGHYLVHERIGTQKKATPNGVAFFFIYN
jgi:hypothetical protein